MNIEAEYYLSNNDGTVECLLCPNNCTIRDGNEGICGVRRNTLGKLDLPYAGAVSALAMDPIEKKPIYHYYPKHLSFSVGQFGCSLQCPYCQNNEISQHRYNKRIVPPEELIDLAKSRNAFSIAYTYNEPTIHFEYITACARLAGENGIKNILVTNGHLNPEPAKKLFGLIDAANIDLKSFKPAFYKKELKGKLEPVKKLIRLASGLTHIEVTTLVIPGKNDSKKEIGDIAAFLASIRKDIPLHLSAYFPSYKYSLPATKEESITELQAVAEQHLDYVYPGNVGLHKSDTLCPVCKKTLIRRRGYSVDILNKGKEKCDNCLEKLPYFI